MCKYYQNENKDVRHVWLSAGVDHFHSSLGDRGWGCGYRNFQMLLSSLLQNSFYNDCLRGIKQNAVCSLDDNLLTDVLPFHLHSKSYKGNDTIKWWLYHWNLTVEESELITGKK